MQDKGYCAFAVKSGYIPYASHLFFPQFLSDDNPKERELGIFMGTVFLDGCKECWVFGNTISEGMENEICFDSNVDNIERMKMVLWVCCCLLVPYSQT